MMLVDAALQFPTVVFTIGLGIALVYWIFVLLGALDIDVLGGADHGGLGDAAIGGAKGGAEALKGLGHDADAGGLWHSLGLGSVPLTITVSVILLVCWVASLLFMEHAAPAISSGAWLPGVLLPLLLLLAVPLTALLVRPLAPLFAIKEGKSNRDYIGHLCTVDTGRVDDGFGQATLEDGGTVLVIQVRCDRPGKLGRGDRALIIDHDSERQAFVVEPAAEMLGGPVEDRSAPERT